MFVCHDESPASAFRTHHSVCSHTKKLKETSRRESEHANAVDAAVIVHLKGGGEASKVDMMLNRAAQQPLAAAAIEL